jgi:hypothetical protein
MTRLIALYPRPWRDRYEIEFRELMADRSPSPRDRIDILRGALDARLHPQLDPSEPGGAAESHPARLGGILAVVGGALWAAAGLAFNGAEYNVAYGYKDTDSAGLVWFVAALVSASAAVLVSRSLSGRHVALSVTAAAAFLGALAVVLPWPILALGFLTTIVSTIVFGFLAAPRLGLTGVLLGVAGLAALGFNTEDARALFLLPLGAAWAVFGVVLAIRGIPAPAAPEAPATSD